MVERRYMLCIHVGNLVDMSINGLFMLTVLVHRNFLS